MTNNTSKAVANLTAAYQKLNTEMNKTVTLSQSILSNVTKAAGANGHTDAMSYAPSSTAMNQLLNIPGGPPGPSGPPGPPGPGGSSDSSSSMSFSRKNAITALGSAYAIGQMTNPSDYIENEMARRRFGFYSGNFGTSAGSMSFQKMMNSGTATSPMDAANAAMAGMSAGYMPGLSNYGTVARNAATISNLMPGVGLEGGMEAMGAMNQAKSVNMLRLIGINVRSSNGLPRNVESIAKDFWDFLVKSKRNRGPITQQELSLSLEPGNYLDLLMTQYFGSDPILRESIIAYLFQKASGGSTSKSSLKATGANPSISQSIGSRNASAYGLLNQTTSGAITGIEGGNTAVSWLSKISTQLDQIIPVFSIGAGISTLLQTLSGGGNGGFGTIVSSLASRLFNAGDGNPMPGGGGMGDGKPSPVGSTIVQPMGSSHITSNWGEVRHLKLNGKNVTTRPHSGVDFAASVGTSVKSVKDGVIKEIGNNPDKTSGYGKYVIVSHDDGYDTVYAHLNDNSLVSAGSAVKAGDVIGLSGQTGAATGPHLHFTVEDGKHTFDPLAYLAGSTKVSDVSPEGVTMMWGGGGNTSSSGSYGAASLSSSTVSAGDHSLFGKNWDTGSSLFSTPWSSAKGDGVPASVASRAGSSQNTTVHIHVNGGNFNEETLAREVKRIINNENKVRMAVTR